MTTIDNITNNPDAWIGQRVLVAGEVDEADLLPRAFEIGGDEFLGLFGPDLLVVPTGPLPSLPNRPANQPLLDDDVVQISGTVQRFSREDVSRQHGIDLPADQLGEYDGELAIIADEVRFTVLGAERIGVVPGLPAPGLAPGETPSPVPVPSPDAAASPAPVVLPREAIQSVGSTIDDILDNPDPWVGQQVTVTGEVDDQLELGPRAFTLEDDDLLLDDHLLVVAREPLPTIADRPRTAPYISRDILQVTGTVQRFNLAEVERETGLDLDEARFGDFEGRPVLLAEQVTFISIARPAPARTPAVPEPALSPTPAR